MTAPVPPARSRPDDATLRRYWRRNLRLIVALLSVAGLVSFGVAFAARALRFPFFGWPFSFWVAAQGALVVYLVVVAWYAWRMGRLDDQHGLADDGPDDAA